MYRIWRALGATSFLLQHCRLLVSSPPCRLSSTSFLSLSFSVSHRFANGTYRENEKKKTEEKKFARKSLPPSFWHFGFFPSRAVDTRQQQYNMVMELESIVKFWAHSYPVLNKYTVSPKTHSTQTHTHSFQKKKIHKTKETSIIHRARHTQRHQHHVRYVCTYVGGLALFRNFTDATVPDMAGYGKRAQQTKKMNKKKKNWYDMPYRMFVCIHS